MKKSLSLFGLLYFAMAMAFGQAPYFQQYFVSKKKEAFQVNAIFQDKTGFMWYGTDKGLFKFDGLKYVQYTTNDSLPDNHVTAIAQDSQGRIWTGFKNGRIAFFEESKIKLFDPEEGASTMEISDILFDHQGNLWFSTLNDGLYYFIKERLYRLDQQEGMPDLFVYDLEEDQYGNIWAGTDGGVAVITLKDANVRIKVVNYDDGLPDNIIKKLVAGEGSEMWMATEDAGIIRYDLASSRVDVLIKNWEYGTVTDFLLLDDQFWIASQQSGIIVFDRKTSRAKVYNAKTGPGFATLTTLLKDTEGNIWAGSKIGILRAHGDVVEFVDKLDPSMDLNILALTIDHQGSIWFANSEGLFRRRVDKTGSAFTEQMLGNTPFKNYAIISLYTDSAGYVWAGMYGEGVVRINPVNGKIRHLQPELRNGNVLSITGKGDAVWLATLGGCSEIKIAEEVLSVKNYSSADGLISDYIYQVFIDSQGRIWIATDGKGVDMLDESGFHHYQEGLTSKVVYGFVEDGNHRIWVNTQGSGLFEFDGAKFRPFRAASKLRDTNITSLASNTSGNLVMIHDAGIDIYDIKTDGVTYLGEEVGIRDKNPNLNAMAKDDQGRIYFGTEGGIVSFSGRLNSVPRHPLPLLERIKVFDHTLDPAGYFRLQHDENNLTIQFLGLWYQSPDNLFYQYKLENYDVDWIGTGDHTTTYSRLPPGKYTFRLKVSETKDFSGVEEATFQVEIRPPFWKTATFFIILAFVIISSGYSFLRYRERKLVRDKHILEGKVEERTLQIQKKNMEIQAQNDEIQAQNEEIMAQAEEIKGINENLEQLVQERTMELEKKNKALEEYAFINAHKLRAPVASILGLINLVGKTGIKGDAEEIKNRLQDAADELDDVVRTITKAIERGDK